MSESDYSAEYVAAAAAGIHTLNSNVYIEIEGVTEKFSTKTVVGLANNVAGLLIKPQFKSSDIDINTPKTPLQSITFTLIDEGNRVSAAFKEKDLHEKTVNVFTIPDASLDFSKYALKAQYRLKDITSTDGNLFILKCVETGELLIERLIIGTSVLVLDINNTQTTGIQIENVDEFTGTGTKTLIINNEAMRFIGINASNELQAVTRGVNGTTAADHDKGDDVEILRQIVAENIIDIILQLLISEGGGGVYDVLDFGMGISQDLVDITEFERVRDTTGYLTTATTDLDIRGDKDNFIEFIEDNFLEVAALRLWYRDNGKISLLVLAEPVPVPFRPMIDKSDMVDGLMPRWNSNSRRIVNILKVKVNFNVYNGKFERELVFSDDISIQNYGKKAISKMTSQALQTGNGAQVFLNAFANKFFTFFSTPAPTLDKTTLLANNQYFDSGNVLDITHPDLPNLITGERGVDNDKVQILSKNYDFSNSTTRYKLFYARLLNIRIGFIAPTGTIKAGSWSTSVFEIVSADLGKFLVGDVVRLWNRRYDSPPVNFSGSTITAVDGDEITVSPAFSTIPLENYRLRYADYDVVQESQKVYAFVGKTGGQDFDDGVSSYKIST